MIRSSLFRRMSVMMAITVMLVTVAVSVDAEAPQVQGFTVGIAFDDLFGTTQVGVRGGYWWRHFGIDVSLHSSAYIFELSDSVDSETIVELSQGFFGLGFKAGGQVDRTKIYGRLGFGGFVEEDEDLRLSTSVSTFDLGIGADFAVSDNFVIGINFLDVRVYSGEIASGGDSVELGGVGVRFLQGGHISFQL